MEKTMNVIQTRHSEMRCAQRGIPPLIIEWLFGEEQKARGATIFFFSKESKRRLCKEVGKQIVSQLSKYLRAYAVIRDGVMITAGHRFKPIHRDLSW
jgi:hypothetical protein